MNWQQEQHEWCKRAEENARAQWQEEFKEHLEEIRIALQYGWIINAKHALLELENLGNLLQNDKLYSMRKGQIRKAANDIAHAESERGTFSYLKINTGEGSE